MNMKMKARLAGLIETSPWTKGMERCRTILEREITLPLPVDMLLAYVRELGEREKQAIASKLEFPIARRDVRQWPEMLFMKMFRTALQQSNRDDSVKRRLLFAVIDAVPALTEVTQPALETLLREREDRLAAGGFWPYYWTVYFHPDKMEQEEIWRSGIETLAEWRSQAVSAKMWLPAIQAGVNSAAASDVVKLDKKIQRLEGIYEKETALRQSLEQELAQKEKLLRQKADELARLEAALAEERREAELEKEVNSRLQNACGELEKRLRQEQAQWLEERGQHFRQLRTMHDRQRELERKIDDHQAEIVRQEKEKEQWKRTAGGLKRALASQDELIPRLERLLHEQIADINASLLQSFGSSSDPGAAAPALRGRMRQALDLADALAGYRMNGAVSRESLASDHRDGARAPGNAAAPEGLHVCDNPAKPETAAGSGNDCAEKSAVRSAAASAPGLYGTFYRRDHGGYVKLETGETFNITESMVYRLDLQHEAELLCTPDSTPGKPYRYELELLFQGDDAYSPVRQFDGYVEREDDGEWYCVDLNDSDNRYPLHPRDVEIQTPEPGDPCTFNVADEGSVARLAKLYRSHSTRLTGPQGCDAHPAQGETSRKRKKRTPADTAPLKREPFLQGCTIAILGGLRKWFEEVVTECGAELVHDGGERPERAAPELKRSQALFLLITSTSHRASWEGIELAKAYGIPHFIIQGSKSNLRTLLWENRELIRRSNI